jgi:hypothetical protein
MDGGREMRVNGNCRDFYGKPRTNGSLDLADWATPELNSRQKVPFAALNSRFELLKFPSSVARRHSVGVYLNGEALDKSRLRSQVMASKFGRTKLRCAI